MNPLTFPVHLLLAIMTNTTISAIGRKRFGFYLDKLQSILDKANDSDTPAQTLYELDGRTPLFMLEALCRMYEKLHNKKIFNKLKAHFKLLEDMLGAVDYYDVFYNEVAADKKITPTIKKYLQSQTEEKLAELDKVLADKGWVRSDNERMEKITSKLKKVDWLDEAEDTDAVKKQYGKSIEDIVTLITSKEIDFDNVEEDVHELRRQLRWLSIYAQCFNGLFQLDNSEKPTAAQEKYLSKEIVNSPYNKMPSKGELSETINLDANSFYALSWLIDKLGSLKDNGLKIMILAEAIAATSKASDEEAMQQAYKLCGTQQMKMDDILAVAKKESNLFFEEDVLGKLIA